MSYCTVFCEVRFLLTYRRNAHVLLYCAVWSSVPLYPQKERSCLIVLRCVKFGSSLPKEGTLMSYCTAFCEVRFLFTHRRNAHVLLYCGLLSSVPLYLQKERSCLIVLRFVKFGSSLPTEGTLMSYWTVVCEVRFRFTYRRNAHVLLYCVLWCSVPLYLQKERLCLIVLSVFVLCIMYPMLPVFLNWPFVIASSVFFNVYLIWSSSECFCLTSDNSLFVYCYFKWHIHLLFLCFNWSSYISYKKSLKIPKR